MARFRRRIVVGLGAVALGGLALLLGTAASAAPPSAPNCLAALVANPECRDNLVEEATSGCPLVGDCATLVRELRGLSADSGECAIFIALCSDG